MAMTKLRTRPTTRLIAAAVVAAVAVAAGIAALGFGNRSERVPVPVALQLSWHHSSASAGYYAAAENGAYADEGLGVEFVEGGARIDQVQSVLDGDAQFGLVNAHELIEARAEGKPVRAIAVVQQLNPTIFISLQKSGITHPRQFTGKTIRAPVGSVAIVRATAERFGIGPDQYTVVSIRESDRFYSGDIDIWTGVQYHTTTRMEKLGHDLHVMYPDNYGVHFYGTCIIATDDYIAAHPDIVQRFLRATLMGGWQNVVRDPASAGSLTALHDPNVDQAVENSFLATMIPLISPGGVDLGWMEPAVWAAMADDLVGIGVLDGPIDPTDLYTMRFLEEIYGADG